MQMIVPSAIWLERNSKAIRLRSTNFPSQQSKYLSSRASIILAVEGFLPLFRDPWLDKGCRRLLYWGARSEHQRILTMTYVSTFITRPPSKKIMETPKASSTLPDIEYFPLTNYEFVQWTWIIELNVRSSRIQIWYPFVLFRPLVEFPWCLASLSELYPWWNSLFYYR